LLVVLCLLLLPGIVTCGGCIFCDACCGDERFRLEPLAEFTEVVLPESSVFTNGVWGE
jgi:hypothetical protein